MSQKTVGKERGVKLPLVMPWRFKQRWEQVLVKTRYLLPFKKKLGAKCGRVGDLKGNFLFSTYHSSYLCCVPKLCWLKRF